MDKYNIVLDNTHLDMSMMWEFIRLRNESQISFYDKINKMSFCFMFPYCIWSKSRTGMGYIPFEQIEADVNRLKDNDTGIFFEFENTRIVGSDFQDRYSNIVLEQVKDSNVSAVIYDNDLAKYIKEKYPSIKIIRSEMNLNFEQDYYFDMKIIDYVSYKTFKDKLENKSSYILAVNSFCKNSYKCSDYLSNNKLSYGINRETICENRIQTFEEMKQNDLFVSVENINELNNEGFETFFVKANCDNRFEILETYLYYLIKPEYRDMVRLNVIKNCFVVR